MANKIKSEIKNSVEYEYFDIDALHGTDPTLSVKGMAADAEAVGKTMRGQPIAVTNSIDFSNQDLLYLYLGEEDGFEYGHIYAYIDGAWVSTELYGKGEQGEPGADAFTPTAKVTETQTGVKITITDKNGTTTADITNGTATDAQVNAWLEAHPEATTTVEDGAVTEEKLSPILQETISAAKPLTTDQYAALKTLLESVVYDTSVLSKEDVATAIDNLIGTKDEGLPTTIMRAFSRAVTVYSDFGETEVCSASSGSTVFHGDVVSTETTYLIKTGANRNRDWTVWCGYTDDSHPYVAYNAVSISPNNKLSQNVTYSVRITVPANYMFCLIVAGANHTYGDNHGETVGIYNRITDGYFNGAFEWLKVYRRIE